jgi:hypothetical protein
MMALLQAETCNHTLKEAIWFTKKQVCSAWLVFLFGHHSRYTFDGKINGPKNLPTHWPFDQQD